MNNVWFTSDTHFGHGNIIKYCHRPFLGQQDREALEANGGTWHDGEWKGKTSPRWRMSREAVEMMDETMISAINTNVGVNDTLWHLGDFAMPGKSQYDRRCRYYRDRLHCQNINLVWGNHDQRSIGNLFSNTHSKLMITAEKQKIVLCHEAFAIWDQCHRGAWNLYGHSHATVEAWMDKIIPGRRSIDVGVDNAYKFFGEFRPFSMEDLRKIMKTRKGHQNFGDNPTEEQIQEQQSRT